MAFSSALALIALFLAALSPAIYERGLFLRQMFYLNSPALMPRINTLGNYEIKFADQVRSCEDGILVESAGVAILACDAGRERHNTVMGVFFPGDILGAELYLYNYKDKTLADSKALTRVKLTGLEDEAGLHTLGIAYHEPSSTLLVTNHHREGSRVEVFKLNIDTATATHVRTIHHPLINAPNSLVFKSEHEFYVTNDHMFTMKADRLLSQLETYLSLPLGKVVNVNMKDPKTFSAEVVARVPYANGIEIINETAVAVSSTSRASVYIFTVATNASAPPKFKFATQIKLPFMADNLSVSSDGRLIIAGHPHVKSIVEFASTRALCNSPAELQKADDAAREMCKTRQAGTWVSEWTEAGGLKHIYADYDFPTGCTAAYDVERKVGIVTGLYAKGILVWRQ